MHSFEINRVPYLYEIHLSSLNKFRLNCLINLLLQLPKQKLISTYSFTWHQIHPFMNSVYLVFPHLQLVYWFIQLNQNWLVHVLFRMYSCSHVFVSEGVSNRLENWEGRVTWEEFQNLSIPNKRVNRSALSEFWTGSHSNVARTTEGERNCFAHPESNIWQNGCDQ